MRRWIVIARTVCTGAAFTLAAGLLVSLAHTTATSRAVPREPVTVPPTPSVASAEPAPARNELPHPEAVRAETRAVARHAPARSAARPKVAPETPSPHQAGMIVGIDPQTGAMGMPTPEQRARLAGETTITGNPAAGLPEERSADGTVTLHLDERFAQYSVVRAGKHGVATPACVDGRDAARRTMHDPAPAPRAAEEE